MDLSISASISREFDVEPGEVFTIDAETNEEGRLVLHYTRGYAGT